MSDLYDTDAALWSDQRVALLRRMANDERVNDQVDWENVIEEIADVQKHYEDEIENRLTTLCVHLLKWQFQPAMRSNGWRSAIVRSRSRISRLARKIPTLAPYPAAALAEAYPDARRAAEAETGRTGLSATCPWTIEQVAESHILARAAMRDFYGTDWAEGGTVRQEAA
jgi:hypothetical protein